jgi:hypothetical protein
MKALYLCVIAFILCSCEEEEKSSWTAPVKDTIAPVIRLLGNAYDTAYLHSEYSDPSVSVIDEYAGRTNCIENMHIEIKGEVDTRFPGNYILAYTAKDDEGNEAGPVTRTVTVVENKAAFLNGGYSVTTTYTAVMRGTNTPTIGTDSYSATVMPFNRQNNFDLSVLKIGPEFVKPSTAVVGNVIEVSFFNPLFHYNCPSTGTLSPAKDSFTIETTAYQWNPPVNYKCRNVYTKLKLEEIKK